MARAESRISLDIDWLCPGEDGVSTVEIGASLDGPPADEIHGATKNALQALLKFNPLEKTALHIRPNCCQQIYVAIVTQGRTKQLQPCDSLIKAELPNSFSIEVQFHAANDIDYNSK